MKKIYILFSLSMIFFSCNQDDNTFDSNNENNENNKKTVKLTSSEYKSIAYDTPKELNENDIIKAVKTFNLSEKLNGKTKNATLTNIAITKKEYVSNTFSSSKTKYSIDSEEIPIYTVEIEDGSSKDIAIISGDERTTRMLAYYTVPDSLQNHSENITDVIECSNNLVDMTKYFVFDELKVIQQLKDSLKEETIEKISFELNIPKNDFLFDNIKDQIIIVDNNTKSSIIQDENANSLVISARYGPWCDVRWNNGMPYNRLMPQSCYDNWLSDYRYPISSVVVAVCQSLCFFKPNLTIGSTRMDWAYLKQKPEIYEESDYFGQYVADPIEKRNMVATLMKYVGEQCKIQYRCDGSSYYYNDVISFLNRMGIAIDGEQGLNIPNMKTSIYNLRPVLMYGQTNTGGGHNWLVDGMISVIEYNSSGMVTNQYIHANMGYGKYYSGYYLLPYNNVGLTFDTGFAHFVKTFKMYANMRYK